MTDEAFKPARQQNSLLLFLCVCAGIGIAGVGLGLAGFGLGELLRRCGP